MTRFTAVVDRFEGDRAVLVLELDGKAVDDLAVPEELLPADARRQDAVLTIEVAEEEVIDVQFDPEETERRAASAQSRFDRLAKRRRSRERSNEDTDGTDDS